MIRLVVLLMLSWVEVSKHITPSSSAKVVREGYPPRSVARKAAGLNVNNRIELSLEVASDDAEELQKAINEARRGSSPKNSSDA